MSKMQGRQAQADVLNSVRGAIGSCAAIVAGMDALPGETRDKLVKALSDVSHDVENARTEVLQSKGKSKR